MGTLRRGLHDPGATSLAKHPVEQHRQPHGCDSELALDDTTGLHVLVEGAAEDDMVGARCCAAYDGAVTEAVRVARGRVERLLSLGRHSWHSETVRNTVGNI